MDIEWSFDETKDEQNILDLPIFEEVGEKHYREDAYGGPYGVLIGGMALPSKYDLSVQYLDAADHLVERIKQQEVEDFTLANPIIFLYRHSIEMLIKSQLINTTKKHSLSFLITEYANDVKSRFSCDMPGWIIARIGEINKIDPESTAFRYAETYDRNQKCDIPVDGELHVYIGTLQTVVRALHSAIHDAPRFRSDLPIYRGQ